MAINAAYAEHHGYSLTILDEASGDFDGGDSRWNKVKILERALDPFDGWAQDVDYLVWIDADFVFLDFSFRLESVVSEAQYPQAHLFISAEHAGSSTLINSGCVVARNSLWARRFLSDWWTHADRVLFSDQEQFDLLYESRRRQAAEGGDVGSFTRHIAILPPDKINSDPPAMIQQKPQNQVLHLMGEETHYRVRVFREGLAELCRHHHAHHTLTVSSDVDVAGEVVASQHVALAPQLSLTQRNLLRWAVEEYSGHSRQLLAAYEAQLPAVSSLSPTYSGPAVIVPQGLHASRTLANSVHHYAHANLHYAEQQQGEQGGAVASGIRHALVEANTRRRDGIVLRKKVYQLLRRNLVAWKKLKAATPGPNGTLRVPAGAAVVVTFEAIRADWPELLKISAIAGQHLLSVTDADLVSMKERRHVAGEILSMMEEMVAESHSAQHDAILLMVADIHSQIGMLDLAESSAIAATSGSDDVSSGGGDERGNGGRPASAETAAQHFTRAALQHFQLSLDVTRRIAEKSGPHLLVSPLTLTANALASLGQFAEARGMYEQAIALNAAHFGTTHASNVALLTDFGISLVHAAGHHRRKLHQQVELDARREESQLSHEREQWCARALQVLSTARQLLTLQRQELSQDQEKTSDSDSVVHRRVEEYLLSAELQCGGV